MSELVTSVVAILAGSTLLIWLFNFIGKKNYITRAKGVFLLVAFALYLIKIFA